MLFVNYTFLCELLSFVAYNAVVIDKIVRIDSIHYCTPVKINDTCLGDVQCFQSYSIVSSTIIYITVPNPHLFMLIMVLKLFALCTLI